MAFFAYITLLFPLAMRTCGADTNEYYKIYRGDYILASDTAFSYLCMALRHITTNTRIGIGIIGAITLALFFFALRNAYEKIDTKYTFFAFATALYFYLYNYVRMMLAASLIFVGYSYMINNRKKALAFFLIAPLFHKSALIVLCVYLVINFFSRYKKTIITAGAIGIAAFVYRPGVFFRLLSDGSYNHYVLTLNISNVSIGLGTTAMILPFFVVLYIYRNQKNEYIYSSALYLCIANLAFALLGYFIGVASRLSNMYFVFHFVFFIPWLIKNEKIEWRRTMLIAFNICYCILKYYALTRNFAAMVIIPYS